MQSAALAFPTMTWRKVTVPACIGRASMGCVRRTLACSMATGILDIRFLGPQCHRDTLGTLSLTSCTGAFVRTGTLGTIVKPTGTNAGTSLVSTEEPAWMESLTTIAPAWRDSPAIDARQTWTTACQIPACTMEPAWMEWPATCVTVILDSGGTTVRLISRSAKRGI